MKKFFDKLRYRFDQFLSKGTVSLVLSLFFAMFLIVAIVGIVLFLFNPDRNLGGLIWASFMQTLDPGNLSGEAGDLLYMIMMTLATVVGIFVTSLFISFILNGFQNRLEKLSRGRSKIIEKGHTLILGWDDNIFVILQQLIEANKSVRHPVIAILSERDSVEMNQAIRDAIPSTFNSKIICRTGSIYKQADLDMCSITDAKSVIILENDMNTIKSLLVVADSDFFKKEEGHVSALMYDERNISVAKNIGRNKLEVIYLRSAITRIITQTCLQPGLSFVYNELLEFEGDEIYFYDARKLAGRSFEDVIFMYKNAAVIGMVRNHETWVKPPMDTLIEATDQLILIAEDDDTATLDLDHHPIRDDQVVKHAHETSRKQENIFIIGFNRKTVEVIREFNNYLEKGSKIKVLVNTDEYCDEIHQLDSEANNLDIETYVGVTYSREVLDTYVDEAFPYIIIFANENIPHEEQDSQTLLTLLHLRDIEDIKKTSFDIITEIADVRNSEIVDLAKVDDFIISELMANKMLAQISENRYLVGIFNHLLSDEGSEIYLKPAKSYVVLNEPVDFYTVSKAAVAKDEIAIGYKQCNQEKGPTIVLNPDKESVVRFQEGDTIIVISED